jgi:hypothetical protein
LSFTGNLSKKIHAKNLKIFGEKNVFFGVQKTWVFGGGNSHKKYLVHKKNRLIVLWWVGTFKITTYDF